MRKGSVRTISQIWIALFISLVFASPIVFHAANAETRTSSTVASLAICQPTVQSSFMPSGDVALNPGICNPQDAIFDSDGNLWVADKIGRVLEFRPPFVSGENASVVIGQKDFASLAPSNVIDESTLNSPQGLAFDKSGNLWVSDQTNNRVLEFRPPFSNGMAASLVIGHSDFTTQTPTSNPTPSSVHPGGLAFDASGNLWVADQGFSRVLEFQQPFSNGMAASVVIGAKNFTWSTSQQTRSALANPVSVTFDSKGNLWVTEASGRILEYAPPFKNGEDASLVIGREDFTQVFKSNPNFTFLSNTNGVAFDSSGNLWVAAQDSIFVFQPPFSNGENASLAVSCPVAKSEAGCAAPVTASSLTFDSHGNLWAASGGSEGAGLDLTQPCCMITLPPYSEGRVLEYLTPAVPEFSAASLAVIAGISLVAVLVSVRVVMRKGSA